MGKARTALLGVGGDLRLLGKPLLKKHKRSEKKRQKKKAAPEGKFVVGARVEGKLPRWARWYLRFQFLE